MKKKILYLALYCLANSALAENLEDVYQLAIKNDQTFQNATATRQAAAEALPQAMSVLFPQISGLANTTMNRTDTEGASAVVQAGLQKYNSHGYTLNLSMPLIDFTNWYGISQAKSSVKAADATYADAAQSLIIRTSQAYFNVLQAEQNLYFARSQKELLAKQLAQSKARYEVGVDALTSVYNVQAQYDAAVATEIANANSLFTAYQNLNVITGKPIDHLSRLVDDLPLLTPNPNNISAWEKAAEDRNFSLLSLRYTATSQLAAIKVAQSGHLPSLSAVDTYQYAQTSVNGFSPGQQSTTTTSSVGLQVNVPLFSGGSVLSQTRQAQAQYVQAQTSLELQHRTVIAQVYQTYTSILAGISKINADRAAIKSANSALASNQAAYQAGTMTIVDVLTAVTNLYNAQQALVTDEYSYLMNTLTLKQLAGNLTNLDVAAINKWLTNGTTTSSSATIVNQQALADKIKASATNSPLANQPNIKAAPVNHASRPVNSTVKTS
ncbi:MAG: tolC [Gammaproteobacteria bacterium]|jgi:outer membrane protein|nr:tolC [Gammaproteobacteria bacterium]